MIALLGESASGKTTLQNLFVEKHPTYRKIIAYTTRPKREGETEGVEYHFVSQATFDELLKRDFFIEWTEYRGWYYGTAKADIKNKHSIAILTPPGLRAIKRERIPVTSVYIGVDRRTRLISLLLRGDDVDEAYRRNLSDVGQFIKIEDEVDYVIDNGGYQMTEEQLLQCLEEIIKIAPKERKHKK